MVFGGIFGWFQNFENVQLRVVMVVLVTVPDETDDIVPSGVQTGALMSICWV